MPKQKLIILHGWNGGRNSWEKFITLAEKRYEVYFISLPCFDGTACPNEVWGVQEYSNYVKNKIEKYTNVGEKKPILLAHSFGGQIAILLTSQYPQLISKLILCCPAIIRSQKNLKRTLLKPFVWISRLLKKNEITNKFVSKIRLNFYKLIGGHDYIEAQGIKLEIFKKITKEDLTSVVSKIATPTIILWGKKDTYTPLKHGQKIASLIPNNKFYIQEAGKHGLHITHPQWILDKIDL